MTKFVADDSGGTGHCAGSAKGPKDWKTFLPQSYGPGDKNTYVEKKSLMAAAICNCMFVDF